MVTAAEGDTNPFDRLGSRVRETERSSPGVSLGSSNPNSWAVLFQHRFGHHFINPHLQLHVCDGVLVWNISPRLFVG